MKNVKLGLFALLGLVGAASAFTNVPQHFNGTTYYAVTDGNNGFKWTQVRPGLPQQCVSTSPAISCTITTIGGYLPTANVVPTSSQANLVGTPNTFFK